MPTSVTSGAEKGLNEGAVHQTGIEKQNQKGEKTLRKGRCMSWWKGIKDRCGSPTQWTQLGL